MAERIRTRAAEGGNYFTLPKTSIQFIQTGCKPLDLALGGGWAEARVANIVGDKSTGKTLLAIEACANFAKKYSKGKIRYREAESAFDPPYAGALGLPLDRVDFGNGQLETVEDFFEDLTYVIEHAEGPELYILDSLDALSDRAEMVRDMDAGTYGAEKAKKLSQLFRRLVRKLNDSAITVIIISQVRDKMNAMAFGKKTTRTGGRALDFYASQVLYLTQIGTLSRTVSGIKRPVGIHILGKVEKNKVNLPMREAQFNLLFGFGIDDAMSCLDWLKESKGLKELQVAEKDIKTYCGDLMKLADPAEYAKRMAEIHAVVERRWYDIEKSFLPSKRKY